MQRYVKTLCQASIVNSTRHASQCRLLYSRRAMKDSSLMKYTAYTRRCLCTSKKFIDEQSGRAFKKPVSWNSSATSLYDNNFRRTSQDSNVDPAEVALNTSTITCDANSVDMEQQQDPEFLSSRIGSHYAVRDFNLGADFDIDVREECRADAVIKAERILTLLRNSLNEFHLGKIIQRLSQYTTLPRTNTRATEQFYRSLWKRFGSQHLEEYKLLVAYLEGRDDDWMQQIDEHHPQGMDDADPSLIFRLSPELVQDPKFVAVVFCYARIACLNSLRLIRRPVMYANTDPISSNLTTSAQSRKKLTALWQVKSDFCRMLDAEGLGRYADAMAIRPTLPVSPIANGATNNRCARPQTTEEHDPEWAAFSLESDRMDFQIMMKEMQQVITLLMQELSEDELLYLMLSVLSSLRTTKLHRKIFQEMVSNIRTRLPDKHQASIMSRLIPFLSGNSASLKDFQSPSALHTLQHHRFRHQAIIRSLLECRMRIGHLFVNDIDDVQELDTVPRHLTPRQREDVVTTAWNIANVLDDRQYHSFFCRFVRYKIAWRPNRPDFVGTFLEDISQRIGPERAPLLMPLFRKTFADLSVETLTICRVKSRYSRKLIRQEAEAIVRPEAEERYKTRWVADRCAFYSNLPLGASRADVEDAFKHIGKVKNVMFFQHPIDGSTPKVLDPFDSEECTNLIEFGVEGDTQLTDLDVEIFDDMDPEDEDLKEYDLASVPKEPLQAPDDTESVSDKDLKVKKRRRRRTRKNKVKIIASAEITQYCALVEFESTRAKDHAFDHALKIFGVMMSGTYEDRAVFASEVAERSTISLQNIAFATPICDVFHQINAILKHTDSGLEVSAASLTEYKPSLTKGLVIPPRAYVTNGRLDLKFPTFEQAVQVIDVLSNYLAQRKRRRPLSHEEEDVHTVACKSIDDNGQQTQHLPTRAGGDTTSQITTRVHDRQEDQDYATRPFDVTWDYLRRKRNFDIAE